MRPKTYLHVATSRHAPLRLAIKVATYTCTFGLSFTTRYFCVWLGILDITIWRNPKVGDLRVAEI